MARSNPSGRALGVLGVGFVLFTTPGLSAPAAKPPAGPPNRAPSPGPVKATPLPAVPPPGNEIMPVSEVREGMRGYGLTVFRGTRIERFDVEVVSVLPRANLDRPLILVKLSGGPISERGAYLIQGMSGSPIYVNGKLLGAFSMGDAWPKEPQGMVTPIEDMLEALDPKLSETPAGMASAAPFMEPSGRIEAGSANRNFRPLALPVMVSGLTGARLDRVADLLRPYNLQVSAGPGPMGKPFAADLTPGAAVGVALMTGDVDMTAIGTVTYRSGDKLLAFGHPMMQIGAAQFPITTAFIHDVFPGFQVSHKIGSAGDIQGTLTQDRPFSVAGRVGPPPTMIPVRVSVSDKATGRDRVFNIRTANHPLLVGQLLPMAVNQSIFNVRPVPGDAFARIKMRVETEGEGVLERENVAFDPAQIDVTAIRDLSELLQTLASNAFRRVAVKSVDFQISLEDRRPTATVDRIFLSQETVKPGDEVEVGVVLRPYRKDPVVMRTRVKVPESAANGRAVLMVQGGSTRLLLAPPGGLGSQLNAPPPDANLRQVLRRFLDRERNDQLAVRMLFPTTAVNVNGERLSGLPSTVVDVMRSSKATGFRIERDETRTLVDTQYVVQGVQMLQVNVEKEDHLEKPRTPTGGTGGGITFGPPGGGLSPLSAGDDELAAVPADRILLTIDGKPHQIRLFTPEEDEPQVRLPRGASPDAQRPVRSTPKPAEQPEEKSAGKKDAEPDAKLVGRAAKLWTQSTQSDFERGTLTNAAVTTAGEVQLAPGLRLAHELDEQFVWSVAGAGGAIFAGTGNSGLIVKVEGDRAEPYFRTGEAAVHALLRDGSGNLYAGTSPNGKVFRITPDGKGSEVLSINAGRPATEAGGKFVLCLTGGEDGAVYAGTGPDGRIFRIRPGQPAEEFARLPVDCVVSLLPSPDGGLYAGTSEGGTIYRVEADGRARVLYDTDQAVITGLAQDRAGNLYAACAPSGEIYRIAPDGAQRVHFNKSKGALYDLKIDGGGNLYTCSANSILRIEPDGTATLLSDRKNGQFTCLAWDEQGRLSAGSANVGSVFRLTPTLSGTFESTIHDARLPAKWGRVRYTASLPSGAVLSIQTRSGSSPEPDATWSEWQGLDPRDGSQFVASPAARFLQYRVLMQAERGSPGLRDISIAYLPRNQAPRLTLAAPVGGEIWRGTQTLKWSAADADGDTLTYDVAYSGDGGRTWQPVGERAVAEKGVTPAEAERPTRASAEEALQKFRDQLEKNPELTPQQREESYQKARGIIEAFFKDNPPPPEPPTPKPAAQVVRPTGATRQASLSWDTSTVPDGVYLLRVTASDRPSNPGEPLQDARTTEPFVVNNTPPQLFVFEKGITIGEHDVQAGGLASGRVSLKGAQYRLDAGDWYAIDPEDGLWDSATEPFRFSLPRPALGEHLLEVKLVDAAGNIATARVKFKVETPR